MNTTALPIAIIGAGPVGLAAAAHLVERGLTPIIVDCGAEVGASVRQWGHVRMFSPWQYTVDRAAVRLLEAAGWTMPPAAELPTGHDLIDRYLAPLAALPALRPHLHLNTRVVAISRADTDKVRDAGRADSPFVLHLRSADGSESEITARAVIDASGTWTQPNPLGANGLPALGERAAAAGIAYGIPDILGADAARYAGKRVLVVGSGHSAINALIDLARLRETAPDTDILWALRGDNLQRVYGGGDSDALEARGKLGTRMQALVESGVVSVVSPFRIRAVTHTAAGLTVSGDGRAASLSLTVDAIITATGARPDTTMLRELRVDLDPALESVRALAPLIDPNIHSCGTVPPHGEAELRQPEPDFYIIGMKSYGRAPTFLLATGYEQARSVVAGLAGDWEAARQVQLELPETGVCSTDLADGGCCAPAVAAVGHIALDLIPVAVNESFSAPTREANSCC